MRTPRFHLCVFCGSRPGTHPVFLEAAAALGREVAGVGGALVYGGAKIGLMGAVADAALEAGAQVIGVIPEGLAAREIGHPGLTELHVVKSLHERKAMMAARSNGFVAMPGGFGTLDEFCEMTTWRQLGLHTHPLGLLNTRGYYDGLLKFIDHAVESGFVSDAHATLLHRSDDPGVLLAEMFP